MKYRKKPVVIEAVQIPPSGQQFMDAPDWLIDAAVRSDVEFRGDSVFIDTLEGEMRGGPGDWIILGVKGEMYPCKPDIFEMTYEPATQEPSHDD